MSKYKQTTVQALTDPIAGALVGFMGADGKEYLLPVTVPLASGTQGVTTGVTSLLIQQVGAGAGTVLTNPLEQCVGSANNYVQTGIQNLTAGANSSADHIAYPDNISNDGTGFVDIGMTSSVYAQAAYSVTGPNEAYVFGSSPSGAPSMTGDLVFATDVNGTSNGMRFYTGGFTKALGAFAMKLTGSGLLQIAQGLALTCKTLFNNGAATTYTVPAGQSYVYLTTSAATLAVTFPAAAAAIDGLVLTFCTSATVASVTFASAGAVFANVLTSLTLNVPVRMIYNHATLTWYPT